MSKKINPEVESFYELITYAQTLMPNQSLDFILSRILWLYLVQKYQTSGYPLIKALDPARIQYLRLRDTDVAKYLLNEWISMTEKSLLIKVVEQLGMI